MRSCAACSATTLHYAAFFACFTASSGQDTIDIGKIGKGRRHSASSNVHISITGPVNLALAVCAQQVMFEDPRPADMAAPRTAWRTR